MQSVFNQCNFKVFSRKSLPQSTESTRGLFFLRFAEDVAEEDLVMECWVEMWLAALYGDVVGRM